MTGPGGEPTVVRIAAPRVEGTIALEDIARRLQVAAQDAAAGHRTGPSALGTADASAAPVPDDRQRLDRLSRLAGQLADELGALPEGLLRDEPDRGPG